MKEETKPTPKPLMNISINQVSNGFITEIARSSAPEADSEDRVAIHNNVDELVDYLKTTLGE